jgi:O-antigen ligase
MVTVVAVGALVPFHPIVAVCIALTPILFLSRQLPIFWLLIAALVARTYFDGPFNRLAGPIELSVALGLMIVFLGLAVSIRGGRFPIGCGVAAVAMFASNQIAVQKFGAEAAEEVLRSISVLAVAIIAAETFRATEHVLIRSVQAIAGISAAASFYQYATESGIVIEGIMRPAGTFAHPNPAAVMYSIASLVSIATYINGRRKKLDLFLFGGFSCASIITASMGGLLVLLVMLSAYALLDRRLHIRSRVVVLTFMGFVTAGFALSSTGQIRLHELAGSNLSFSGYDSSQTSLEWRVLQWKGLINYWKDSFLFGQGYGATTTGLLMNGALPHNEYVRLLVETGIVGVSALAVGVLALLKWLSGHLRTSKEIFLPGVTLAATWGFLVSAMGANTFLYSVPTYAYALLLGGSVALIRRSRISPARERGGL